MFHVEHFVKMEELKACPICNGDRFSPFITCKDYTVSQESFHIVSCQNCGFKFTNPRPSPSEIGSYYKAEEYVSHTDTKKGIVNKVYHAVRNRTTQQKFELVKSHMNGNALLDIGCGTGFFLNYCKQQGLDVLGLEPDADARDLVKKNHGIDALPIDELKNLPDNSRDAISLWHVLEHVLYLKEDAAEFKRVLKPDGTLFIAVPNCSSNDAAVYKEHWAAYDVPRHLYHFVPADIQRLFSDIDMEVVDTLPMKFDAYYVSMLSEKIKGGNNLSALINGWKSNRAAGKSHTYSSQIYVIKPKK